MKIVFFGSSNFSVPPLKSIVNMIPYVVTKKAKPKGRGYTLDDNEVKQAAIEMGLPFIEIETFKDDFVQRELEKLRPELFVVASFGLIFPKWALDIPSVGSINVHPSLLPKYRGPSPIQWAIMKGETETGVTIMKIIEKMDAGNIIYQERMAINKYDNTAVLSERLSRRSSELLPEIVDRIGAHGMMEGVAQKNEDATYTPMITKEMGRIEWDRKTLEIIRQIKALTVWPTAYTFLDDKAIKIFNGEEIGAFSRQETAGTIFAKNRDGFLVATVDGSILVKEVQMENRKKINAYEFANGYRDLIGKILK